MSNIRVTYSGLIAFAVSIISVVTGTIFVVMVTRRLSPEDLGLWTLVGTLVTYVLIIRPMITYWSTRQLSRGEEIGKTTIITSSLFSVFASIAYLGFAFYFAYTTEANLHVFLLATILVPLSFIFGALNSIGIARRPQSISYGLVVFEITKIPIGLLLVVILDLEVIGAILTVILADSARLILISIMVRHEIHGKIKTKNIKFWIHMSWLTIYQNFSSFVRSLDVVVFTVLTGSLVALAYWAIAKTVSTFVAHSEKMTQGLYPKIIATKQKEFAEEALRRTMFFAIPTLCLSIIFVKPILYILNPIYVDGVLIVIVMCVRSFAFMFNNISFEILGAYDVVDENKQTSVKKYIKSKLFVLPTLYYITFGIYIAILVIYLVFIQSPETTDVELVTIWSIIYLAISIPLTIYGMIAIRIKHQIKLPAKSILKYLLIALLSSGITFILLQDHVIYYESVYEFIPQLIPLFLLNISIYFGLTYITDSSTRKLFKLIINELIK